MGTIPDEEEISISCRSVASQYHGITLSPLYHANGSVPKEVRRSPEIIPDRRLVLKIYQIYDKATAIQILAFLDMHKSLHLGALGLILMRKLLPVDIHFLAFEDNDHSKISALINHGDDIYQFGVVRLDDNDDWDGRYGFVCVVPDPEADEETPGYC